MWTDEIVQGDAYELIKQVPDKSVDLIVTDPPYQIEGVHQGTGVLRYRKMGYVDQLMQDGSRIVNGIDNSILDEMCRVMKRINVYLWCNKEQIANYLDYFVAKRGCNFEFIIWCKQNPPPFYGTHYLKDKEYCLYFWETGVKLDIPTFDRGRTVFVTNVNREDKERYVHPTIKPLDIVSRLIENSSAPGGGDIRPVRRLWDHMRRRQDARSPLARIRAGRALRRHSEGKGIRLHHGVGGRRRDIRAAVAVLAQSKKRASLRLFSFAHA